MARVKVTSHTPSIVSRSRVADRSLGHGDLRPVEMNNAKEFSDTVFNCSFDNKTQARLIRRS